MIATIDSDYLVEPDWLRCMVPQFANPRVGFVQSPQDYRDNDGSFFKRLMFWEYAGFFQLGMVTRNERNAIIQHGTMCLIRRAALQANGGQWAEWTITEDAELGLRLFREGWEAAYSPRSFGRGVMPDDFAAFRKQRFRWAYGAMQILRGHAGAVFNPFNRELTLGQRWHFITGWLPWVGDSLGLAFLVLGLLWSIGLVAAPMRFEFPIVLFMIPSIALFFFKITQIFALYGAKVSCGFWDRVGAAIAGLALSHTIGKAVWKGLFIRSAPLPAHAEDGGRPRPDPRPGHGPRGTGAAGPDLDRHDRRGLGAPSGHLGSQTLVRRAAHPVAALSGRRDGSRGRRVPHQGPRHQPGALHGDGGSVWGRGLSSEKRQGEKGQGSALDPLGP